MILCIDSSPREEATKYVIDKTREMIEKRNHPVTTINLREEKINFCIHCDYCLEHEECTFNDGMNAILTALEESKGLVLATPVYNNGISAKLKAVMDRTRALLAKDQRILEGKIGMGIAVGGDRIGGQETALTQIHAFYIMNGIIPVSGGSFGANLGATFWSKDSKEGVIKDNEGFKSLKKTIDRFIRYLEKY